MHIYTYKGRIHIDEMNKDERHSSKKNIPLTLFERFVCESELETEQNCNILTLTLLAITAFLSRFTGLLNRGAEGPLCWLSLQQLVSKVWSPNSLTSCLHRVI